MNVNELRQVAHGLKAARPPKYRERETIDSTYVEDQCAQWEKTVVSIADYLELKDKPRNNFLAAAGLLRHDEKEEQP